MGTEASSLRGLRLRSACGVSDENEEGDCARTSMEFLGVISSSPWFELCSANLSFKAPHATLLESKLEEPLALAEELDAGLSPEYSSDPPLECD